LLTVADMHLGQGAALLYSDRAEAQKYLDQAKSAYERVAAADDAMLKTRARLGLAKAYESLCKPDEALKYYDLVAATEKDSAIGKSAAEAAQRLKSQEKDDFLEWFVKQTPKRPAPLPGIGGNVPGLPGNLSSRPDIGLTPGGFDPLGTGLSTESGTRLPATTPGLPPPADENQSESASQPDAPTATPDASDSKVTEPKATEPKATEPSAAAPSPAEATPEAAPAKAEPSPDGDGEKKSG
jgi:hypothetical protein